MRPQLRIDLDREHQYYFQFLSSDERMVFESLRFNTNTRCAKAINDLRDVSKSIHNYMLKIDHERMFSFVVTDKKREVIGTGKPHWSFATRNLDIRILASEIFQADIVEPGLSVT